MGQLPPLLEPVVKVLELPGVAISIIDGEAADFPVLYVNIGFVQLTGYPREQALAPARRVFATGDDAGDVEAWLSEALTSRTPATHTLTLCRRDGSHFWNELTLSVTENGDGHRYVIATHRDVTDQRRQGLAKAVFDSTHDGIIITDAERTIVDTNPAFTALTGYERAEVIGKKPHILSSGKHDATFYQSLFAAVDKHGFWSGDIWNTRKDGSQLIESSTISAVRNDAGELINYVGVFRDITQQRLNQARLERMAIYDPLTGLYNREHFTVMLESHLAGLHFVESGLAVLFMDLDDFKPINDSYGHAAGDELLVEVSRRLKRLMRSTDIVARFGGDEFVVALGGMGNSDKAFKVGQKIIADLTQPFLLANGEQVNVSVSIGLAFTSDYRQSPPTLIDSADHAMYEAKLGGKNRIAKARRFVESRSQDAFQRIREAFENGELELYYQPIIDLASNQTHSFEALARWRHPQKGLLGPQHFINVIMHSSLSLPFGQWLVREAGHMAKRLQDAGHATPVSINLSQDQIETGSFLRAIVETRDALELTVPYLTIEVLESSHFHDLDLACSQLLEARLLGTSIALDDFGAGISSITYANHLPIDTLKIDLSAIKNIDSREDQRQFVGGIIDMAHAMQRQVLAEGVERDKQLEKLRELGCDLAQGFLFGEPMPVSLLIERYLSASALPAYPLKAALSPEQPA